MTDFSQLPSTIGDPVDDDDLLGEEEEQEELEAQGGEGEGEGEEAPDEPSEIDALKAHMESQFSSFQRTLSQLIQKAPGDETPAIDFSDLPDPVTDAKAFNAALGERVNKALTTSQQAAAQADQAAKVNALWEGFKTEYADLAPKELLARSAAAAELEDARARGLDSLDWAVNNPVEFRKKVADRMRKELGVAAPAGDTRTPKPGTKPANRTGGVSGGSKGAGTSGGKKPEKPAGFLDQMKKSQLDAGLI